MNIDHLHEFAHLAETLNFRATAKHFFLSPSMLSKHIAIMEQELGCKLFIRDSHAVSLTEEGIAFKNDIDAIIGKYQSALTRVKVISEEKKRAVEVGYLRNASRPFLADFLRIMKETHPDIVVSLRCMEVGDALYALSTGTIDLHFGLNAMPFPDDLVSFKRVYDDKFFVVASCDHPLAAYDSIGSDQLEGNQVLLPDSECYNDMDQSICQMLPKGLSKEAYSRYRDVDTLFVRVEAADCVGFSSGHNYPIYGKRVKFISLSDCDTSYEVGAFTPKNRTVDGLPECLDVLDQCAALLEKRYAKYGPGSLERFTA
ncbi:MAG: LysR family transcriptional regulator [Coriobacteriaceae bacterium]|nr:LysR family transcriptional regulator [Coriobacteriaceae bacterium]